jgi:hypothetical protein
MSQKTGFSGEFPKYFLSGFAVLLGLFLKPLGLDAELNSAPNPSGFRNNPSRIANPDKKCRIWC